MGCIVNTIKTFEGGFDMKGVTFADSTMATMNELLEELVVLRTENQKLQIENKLIKALFSQRDNEL